ncbi:Protein of unknown function [Andreprevotia lacus DSM 23236]|jgi:hypothetical protein|uniref:Uncharacterized protein n=1 Tax=Andreprevotia lacus DSM 23236 TaxID=1121001 RepID=A0A1W1X8U6_9NEIS|nr:DUF3828 domain-containing protein [Andreprevotia lacus]SMC20247.1 Protein of unknown function [Andreprevotia lacus DSM 23236]
MTQPAARPDHKLQHLIPLCLALCCLALPASHAVAATAASASATAPANDPALLLTRFYGWYLDEFDHGRSPLTDQPRAMQAWVSRAALKRIRAGFASGRYDSDYFTRTQDILEDWPAHVAVSKLSQQGHKATAIVTLGRQSPWSLRVQLSLGAEGWRIETVTALHP